jgi:exopolysaccharide biosynthesis protein
MPHARTALGIRHDGHIVMIVVEHGYGQSLNQITLEQAQELLRSKAHSLAAIEQMSLAEAKTILREHFSQSTCIGLNLLELAKLMVSLGCRSAINLDGGGSSALFLNGHIVNTSVGDEDEAQGQQVVRPVSDALVVVRR